MTPERFKQIREEATLTQAEAAKYLRVHLRSVQKWEGDERAIPGPVEVLMEMLEAKTKDAQERKRR